MFFEISRTGEHSFFQYVVGIAMIVLAVLLGNLPLALVLVLRDQSGLSNINDLFNSGINSNLMLLLIVMPFVFGLLGLLFVVRRIHHRKGITVVTSRSKIDWSRVGLAFGLWFLANLIFELINYWLNPQDYTFRGVNVQFLVLLLVALLFLPLQVAFEELLFRGYLLQGLGRLVNNRWLPMLLTSVVFGLMHGQNPEVAEYGMGKMMLYYIGFGLILAIITVMDNGLELALGIHAATNIYSAIVVSYEGAAIQTDALFHSSGEIVDNSIYSFLVFAIIFTCLLAWIYKWKDWGRIWRPISGKLTHNEIEIENTN